MPVEAVLQWIDAHSALLWWLAASSVVMFIASLIVVPLVIARIPADYFAHQERPARPRRSWPTVTRMIYVMLKNAIGLVLVVAGIVMLVLPGQGLITLFIGLTLMDFPGKYRLERHIVAYPGVRQAMNWLRARRGAPPLRF